MYIQRYLEKYEREDVINDYQSFVSVCQKTQEGINMRDKIIHFHTSLVTKIKKIQMKVNKTLDHFFNHAIPWSPTIQVH